MKRMAQFLVWGGALLLAIWLIDRTPAPEPVSDADSIELPADSPDVYVTGLKLTRFNDEGQPTLTTDARDMSIYNDSGESRLSDPIIHRLSNGDEAWRITARQATVFRNNDIELTEDVLIVQLEETPALTIDSEQMRYSEQAQRIETDRPVQVTQGQQRVNAIGLTVNLDTIEPVIQLLSDVDFYYDPS